MRKENLVQSLDKFIYYFICLYAFTVCFDVHIHFDKIALGLAVIRICLQRNQIKVGQKHLYFIGAFLIALLPSIFFNSVSDNYLLGLNEYRKNFLSPLLLLFVLLTAHFTKEQIKKMMILTFVSLFINDFFVIWQGSQSLSRPAGISGSCMFLGGIILLLCPILVTSVLDKELIKCKKIRNFGIIIIMATIVAAVYNGTRIVWIGLAIILPFLLSVVVENRKKLFIYLFIIALGCSSFFVHNQALNQRLHSITDSNFQSNTERVLMWQSAWNMFKDHPVVGVGVGNYKDQFESIYKSKESKEANQEHPHNVLLNMLSQAGIVGGVAYLSMFSYFLYESYYAWYRNQNKFALMFLTTTIGYLINSLTDCVFGGPFLTPLNDFYWFVLGCYLILSDYVQIRVNRRCIE